MQKNIKVAGIVDESRGQQYAARVKVVSCKKGSEWIDDPQTLIDMFPPSGFVFSGNILEKFKFGDLLELTVVEYASAQSNSLNDQYKMESLNTCRLIGHRLIKMDVDVRFDELSIDLSKIKERIESIGTLKDFYIQVGQEIFGAFNLEAGELTAAKEIGVNTLNNQLVANSKDYSYLIRRPVPEKKVDAMTTGQLSLWFKDKLKHHDIVPDLDALKRALESQGPANLDSIRMRRAFELLDQLELSQNDFSILCQYSQNFADLFQKALDQANDEIVGPLRKIRTAMQKEIDSLENDKEKLLIQISHENKILNLLKSDVVFLEQDRERLINDIRIHSLIGQGSVAVSELIKYEVIDFIGANDEYELFPDYLKALVKDFDFKNDEEEQLAAKSAIQLTHFKCLLAWQPEFLLNMAKASNNCRVFIQQAEADWLKFDSFFNNGLKDIWESAHDNPSLIHFLIIQDFNLAIIDCYARPLLDLNTGLRNVLPGCRKSFPSNLRIFAVPINNTSCTEFGLPLIRESFNKWGALPKLKDIELAKGSTALRLSVNILSKPFLAPNPDFTYYFQD